MLTVAKVTGTGAAGYAEYLQGKAQSTASGDYYLKDGDRVEAPGRWVAGAGALGCDPERPVSGEVLGDLMAVRRPDTGRPLRRVGGSGEAVAAIDATFSAPKSVSAIWALAGEQLREEIERAHEQAIDRALAHATGTVAMIRERTGPTTVIKANARMVIATSWRHITARAVADLPPDPQLHSHVLLHGAVRGDGQIVAIDSRAWFVHRRELGAAYRIELAHQLTHLGFQITRGTGRGGRYFEIDGVPGGLIDRWSGRHHQVQQAITARLRDKETVLAAVIAAGGPDAPDAARRLRQLQEAGRLAAGEDRLMTALTRSAKQQCTTRSDLDQHWSDTGRLTGLAAGDVERLRAGARTLEPAGDRELLRRLTEFDATFAEHDARAVALEASAGSTIAQSLSALDQLRQTGEVLALADGRQTTRGHRHAEQQTITLARRLAADRVSPIPPSLVAEHTRWLDDELTARGGRLSAEQRDALALGCSDAQLVVIEGQAGTGKSTVLTGVARAHQADGRQIVVTSTAALAAQRLATELTTAGVDTESWSTAALHAAIGTGRVTLTPATTVIHDEAALASTREQQHLLSAIQTTGARLIAVGDPSQSQPVGAGGLWPALEHATRDHQTHIELTRNVRAADPADRRDQRLFREGHHQDAIHGYHARHRVALHPEQRQAEDAALEAAHADFCDYQQTLVIAQTSNEHLDQLNARAQAIRLQHHELGDQGLDITGRPYRLHTGDLIQIRHAINHDTLGQIRNGQTALIIDVQENNDAVVVYLGQHRHGRLTRDQIDRADLRLAYVQHPFPAQGPTTDTAHLIVSEHATQDGSYVAITRARQRTHLYASHQQLEAGEDPLQALAEHIGRSEPDLPSIRTPLAHEAQIESQQARAGAANRAPVGSRDAVDPLPGHSHQSHQTEIRDGVTTQDNGSPSISLVALLGPRPQSTDPTVAVWQRAVTIVQGYRNDYGVSLDEPAILGPEPAAGEFQQRLDRRRASLVVHDALAQLGRLAPDDRRGLDRPAPDRGERTIDGADGWEP